MKKIMLVFIFMIVIVSSLCSVVFMTEIADPNNNLNARYIEFYNNGDSTVDFTAGSGWRINKYTNGSATVSSYVDLSGTIEAGGFYILAYDDMSGTFLSIYGFAADQLDPVSNGTAGGNGDDTLELIDGTGVVVDFYGVQPHADLSNSVWEFEDGRAERAGSATSGTNPPVDADWNTWSDGPGGDVVQTQDAPGDFDPGAWIGAGGNLLPSFSNIAHTPTQVITSSTPVSVSADVTDIDGTISLVELHWGTTSGSLGNTINMSTSTSASYTTESLIPAQSHSTTVYYSIYAEDDLAGSSTSSERSYTVFDAQSTTIPYYELFSSGLGQCYPYSVSGASNEWYWDSGEERAGSNGFGGSNPEEDWLILPKIDLTAYTNEILTFTTYAKYGMNDETNYLKLYYSTDYPGLGDPSSSTWIELAYTQPTGINNSTEVSSGSGNIDLSAIDNSNVYLGYKYYSSDSPTRWAVDDIIIREVLNDTDSSCNYTGVFQPGLVGFTSMNNNELAAFDVYSFNVVDTGSGDIVPTYVTQITIDAGPSNIADWTDTIAGAKVSSSGTIRAEFNATTITDEAIVFENIPVGTFEVANNSDELFTLSIWLTDTGDLNEAEQISLGINGANHGFTADDSGSQFDGTFMIDSFFDIFFEVEGTGLEVEGFPRNVNPGSPFGGGVKVVDDFGNTDKDATGAVTLSSTNAPITTGTGLVQTLNNGLYTWNDLIYPTSGDEFKVRADYSLFGWFIETATISCFEAAEILINEVDADTPGTDAAEFIELYDGGVGNYLLDGYVVVLYNGGTDVSYNAIDLDGFQTDVNGYFVIGSTGMGTDIELSPGSSGWLQNGADAVALYLDDAINFPNGTPITIANLVDAIVYDTSDGDDAGLLVLLNAAEPQVNEDGNGNKDTESNQRIPNGSGGLRNTSTYAQTVPTPGAENVSTSLDPSTNLVITHDGTNVTITWDAVSGANSYNILSCDTPDGTFVSVGITAVNSWINAEVSDKKFYQVEASTEIVP